MSPSRYSVFDHRFSVSDIEINDADIELLRALTLKDLHNCILQLAKSFIELYLEHNNLEEENRDLKKRLNLK